MGNKESSGGPPPASRPSTSNKGGGVDIVQSIDVQKREVGNLEKKIQQLTLRMDAERKMAKQLVSMKTDKAANQVKAKRHLMQAAKIQKQISKFEGMRNNIESVQYTLEAAAMTRGVHQAMADGNKTLGKVKDDLNPDAINEIVDDIADNTQILDEATDLLSQPVSQDAGLDMDADDELAAMMNEVAEEEAEEEAPAVKVKKPAPKLPTLPVAPTGKVVIKGDEDEEEALAALARDMS